MTRKTYDVKPDVKIFDEFPMESEFDVAIIGGGPNGLMAAAYLSRAGLRTLLIERRHEIGGGLATEETLFPGYYTNPHAIYHMMTDYLPVLRDFDISPHGLTFVKPNVQVAGLFENGESLVLCSQVEDSKDSMAKFSPKDAAHYGKLMRQWRRLIDDVVAPGTYVPPLAPIDLIEAFERTEVGREVLRLTEMSPVEIIDENFTDERIKTIMLYLACMWGLDPHDTGLGFLVPLYIDRAMNKAVCYGGSHKFAGSLSRVIHANGGLILDNAEVTRIIVEDGRATGVEIFDGRVVHAKAVLSSLPPPQTFGQLIERQHVPAELVATAEEWEWEHWSFFTVALATEHPPTYETDDPWVNDAFMTIMGYDSTDQLLDQWDAVRSGELGDHPGGHSTVETRYDPTLPRIPGHAVSFLQTHVPGQIDGGWKARSDEMVDRQMEIWRRYAPNLNSQPILIQNAESPLDIETRLPNMVNGSIKHGDYNSLQMGAFRPHESCIGGRTPIEGLYLCGASSYPGGLVIGGPGYIAATTAVEDLEADKWWKLPNWVERYRDTYLSDQD